MSFSSDIKAELCTLDDDLKDCCKHAFVYGLLLFSHFSELNLSITTEHKEVYDLYVDLLKNYIGVTVHEGDPNAKKITAYVGNIKEKSKVFDKFGHSSSESALRLLRQNLDDECCYPWFLRGAFLSCGSVSDPNLAYHLEFVVPYKKLSQDFMTFLRDMGLEPKYILRKGYHIVYFKDSESIEDILALIGAQNASLTLMGIKIEKDIKNKVNRKLNFEMSNFDKVLAASNSQIEAIRYIMSHGGTAILPEKLRKVATLRFENPEASLSDLQEMLNEDISRSGIKHRLDKIVEISQKLEEN